MTKLVNRAKMTTATTGTGTITLGSAGDGYQTFADAGVANSDVVRYVIEDGDAWEIGLGTYSSGTLTRGSIESSNADAALNLTGNAVVFVSAAAADLQELVDFADNFVLPTADGTNGQVLTTNGAGTLTFSTISGGATSINGLSDGYSVGESVGLGSGALAADDGTTNRNTAVGWQSGNAVTSGALNTFVGYRSGYLVSTGGANTAVGWNALDAVTTTGGNTAVGSSAGGNYTSQYSVFLGDQAGFFQTTGEGQVFVGYTAGAYSRTGLRNIGIGHEALYGNQVSNFSGSYNTGIGYQTGFDLTTGEHNFLGGYRAGYDLTTGSNNVAIGNGANDTGTTNANTIVIGFGSDPSSATVSNEITLGNSSITTLRCQVTTITSLSDARDKTDIQPLNAGLEFVEALNPVSFTWNMRDGGKVGVSDTGFIAQDLQAAQAETGVSIPGLVYDVNPDKLEAGYGKLIPVLVQAIKDLSAEVKTLKAKLEAQN